MALRLRPGRPRNDRCVDPARGGARRQRPVPGPRGRPRDLALDLGGAGAAPGPHVPGEPLGRGDRPRRRRPAVDVLRHRARRLRLAERGTRSRWLAPAAGLPRLAALNRCSGGARMPGMDEAEVIRLIRALPGVVVVTAGPDTAAPEVAWGDSFAFYDPDDAGEAVRRFPFATVVTKDYPGFDTESRLGRPGVFRLNLP